jgi:polyhydroxyalkanoate synthesis regulator phasin
MNSPDDNYVGLLLEQIRDQNKAVLEAVGDMQQKVAVLPAMQQDIAELKQEMKVVRAATTDTSRQVHDLERRVSRLEAA